MESFRACTVLAGARHRLRGPRPASSLARFEARAFRRRREWLLRRPASPTWILPLRSDEFSRTASFLPPLHRADAAGKTRLGAPPPGGTLFRALRGDDALLPAILQSHHLSVGCCGHGAFAGDDLLR